MKAVLAIGAVVLVGVGVGFALERTGFLSPIGESSAVAGLHEVPFYPCPGEDRSGDFHGGDRVFITGRDAAGDWLEVRAPFDVQARVWVENDFVTADSVLDTVPQADCTPIQVADTTTTTTGPADSSTTTTSIVPPASTTTTSIAPPASTTTTSTSTTQPPPTTTTTTSSTTTTTTEPPPPADTTGPTIDFFQSDESDLWEDGAACTSQPHTAQVGGVVFDPSGIGSVWIDWSVGAAYGTTPATELAADVYFAEVGPFPESTLVGVDSTIYLQITAYDTLGNETIVSSSALTVLHDCTIQ